MKMLANKEVKPDEKVVVFERRHLWERLLNFKIGIIPLAAYLPLLAVCALLLANGKLPKDMIGAIAIAVLLGFTLAEIGERIPVLNSVGGHSILVNFVPAYLVYAHLLPKPAIDNVTTFMKSTNFLYVYISMITVGSILGMNRNVLIKAITKMFIPLIAGTLAAVAVCIGLGTLLGIGAYKSFFFIAVPIMAGGMGDGAVPLSIGYAEILKTTQNVELSHVVPAVMLGSLSAIVLAGLLKRIGEKKPELTGNGILVKTDESHLRESLHHDVPVNLKLMGAGLVTSVTLYLIGTYLSPILGIPNVIIMLLLAAFAKFFNLFPKSIQDGSQMIYRFFAVAVTYPLMVGVGIAMTSWKDLISVLSPAYLLTIFCTVLTMVTVGFYVGKWMNMYPVESALVTACHSGQGGTGDVAILTAADRLSLMPFAQVATRIGGAVTVTLAIFLLRWLQG
jgi:malate:Na+ symporter